MLSNISIKNFLDSGDIIISPWDDEMMDACRVTLHLGNKILIPEGDIVIDVQTKTLPQYKEITITQDTPFRLEPKMFVLGHTHEKIGLSKKVGALLDGRSTLARLGLQVTQTAMIIDAGQLPKTMTLEIYNAGSHPILFYPKMKFCRVCFFELTPHASMRADQLGKYHTGDGHKPILKTEFKSDIIKP